jgi:hypothetical protein
MSGYPRYMKVIMKKQALWNVLLLCIVAANIFGSDNQSYEKSRKIIESYIENQLLVLPYTHVLPVQIPHIIYTCNNKEKTSAITCYNYRMNNGKYVGMLLSHTTINDGLVSTVPFNPQGDIKSICKNFFSVSKKPIIPDRLMKPDYAANYYMTVQQRNILIHDIKQHVESFVPLMFTENNFHEEMEVIDQAYMINELFDYCDHWVKYQLSNSGVVGLLYRHYIDKLADNKITTQRLVALDSDGDIAYGLEDLCEAQFKFKKHLPGFVLPLRHILLSEDNALLKIISFVIKENN